MTDILIALSNPVPGKDAEYRDWYLETHLSEVRAVPGVKSARAYILAGPAGPAAPFRYATIYEIDGSAQDTLDRLRAAPLNMSDTMSFDPLIMAPFASLES